MLTINERKNKMDVMQIWLISAQVYHISNLKNHGMGCFTCFTGYFIFYMFYWVLYIFLIAELCFTLNIKHLFSFPLKFAMQWSIYRTIISITVVWWLASSPRVRKVVGPTHGRVKPRIKIGICCLCAKQLLQVSAKTGRPKVRIMFLGSVSCLPVDWFVS